MNSKNKGNLGEIKTLCKFISLNVPVYIPFGDNERADIIAEFNNKLNKIQVKSASLKKNGTCSFPLYSFSNTKNNNGKGYKKLFYKDEIDYYAFYNITEDKLFLYKNNDYNKNEVVIRYTPTKNNQSKRVIYYEINSFEAIINI